MKILFCLFLPLSQISFAQISLPRLISDGVVLQRDEVMNLWGKASPYEKIMLSISMKNYKTQADGHGDWKIDLPPHPAGGPFELVLTGKNEVRIKNVLFGDVWLCSGQSNMVLTMERVKEKYAEDIRKADYPEIRNFFIKTTTDLNGPRNDLSEGEWKVTNAATVLDFGAVSYFFARAIYNQYHIPIGIINSSVGGTPIEAWISESGFNGFPELQKTIAKNKDTSSVNKQLEENRRNAIIRPSQDEGLLQNPKWFDTSYQEQGWRTINIPGYWEDQGLNNLDGIVWYRRDINLPKGMADVESKLFMGRIVDADQVFINGKQIGQITYQYPPRRYTIPQGLLKPGKNTIVIRVQNYGGKGGFVPDKPYYITANGLDLDLKGTWKYKIGQVYEPIRNFPIFSPQNQPAALYNAMTAPIVAQTKIKGVLWYQGESNTGNPKPYTSYLPALIHDYRNLFHSPGLPFLYVQLANYMDQDLMPVESNWAELRQAQLDGLKLPNTAMTVSIDLGEWNDIHPLNKKDVGNRLALAARTIAYGEKNIEYSGPVLKSSTVSNGKVCLEFEHIGSGLKSSDGEPLGYFSVAGEDKKYVWATTQIIGNKLEVFSEKIKAPCSVRYAWANNPVTANFSNESGLPASPFEVNINKDYKLWHGKKAAIVLTYDDALDVHLDKVIPALDSLGLKATFFLSASFPGSQNRILDWQKAARDGHELGNHTLYHPCDAGKPGRSWVLPQNDLRKYTIKEIMREIDMTNTYLESLDGKKERTFAYPCGDTETGEGSYIDSIQSRFIALRGVRGVLNKPGTMNIRNMDCFVIDDTNVDQLRSWAEKAKDEHALMVVLFHGVGGGHNINVDLNKHNQFLNYLNTNQSDFWVTTLLEAAKNYIQSKTNKE